MVKYPNGLTCAVSEKRANLYEAIVPILTFFLIIFGGIEVSGQVFRTIDDLSWAMVAAIWSFVAWAVFCALIAYGLFVVWCKPIDEKEFIS